MKCVNAECLTSARCSQLCVCWRTTSVDERCQRMSDESGEISDKEYAENRIRWQLGGGARQTAAAPAMDTGQPVDVRRARILVSIM